MSPVEDEQGPLVGGPEVGYIYSVGTDLRFTMQYVRRLGEEVDELMGSGSYLRPKAHIQHTHPQHLSTSTQTSTNHKSTHRNRMG